MKTTLWDLSIFTSKKVKPYDWLRYFRSKALQFKSLNPLGTMKFCPNSGSDEFYWDLYISHQLSDKQFSLESKENT